MSCITIIPLSDNKLEYKLSALAYTIPLYSFLMKSKIHHFIKTEGLTLKESNTLKKETYNLIHNELVTDSKK